MKIGKNEDKLSEKRSLVDDRYLDLKGLSLYSSLSVRTLRSLLTGPIDALPSYRVNRKVLVRKSDFDRWIMKHRTRIRELDTLIDEVLADVL